MFKLITPSISTSALRVPYCQELFVMDLKFVLVSYMERKKVINIDSSSELTDLEFITKKFISFSSSLTSMLL